MNDQSTESLLKRAQPELCGSRGARSDLSPVTIDNSVERRMDSEQSSPNEEQRPVSAISKQRAV